MEIKVGVIADDLTGANDTGVQFTRYRLSTTVSLSHSFLENDTCDVFVCSTESRSMEKTKAYLMVRNCVRHMMKQGVNILFKKIDSTLRGNIGAELDAVYEEYKPDFLIIAPAFPQKGRIVDSGNLLVNRMPLNQTDISSDPKTPVNHTYIPDIIHSQTSRNIACINNKDIRKGKEHIYFLMSEFYKRRIPYILFDSNTEEDLYLIAKFITESNYKVVWVGSAGLARCLPLLYGLTVEEENKYIPTDINQVLLLSGSASSVTSKQINTLLKLPNVTGVELDVRDLLSENWIERIREWVGNCETAFLQGKSVAVFPTNNNKAVELAHSIGEKKGMNKQGVSNVIVERLGLLSKEILDYCPFKALILTGGDTAKEVCVTNGIKKIELLGELETGVPIGKVSEDNLVYIITKAGAFGEDNTFVNIVNKLQGRGMDEVTNWGHYG